MYITASIMPGISAPMNSLPTEASEVPKRSAISTSMMLGGIRMPKVPTEQAVPTARLLLYLACSIGPTESMPSNATEAPTMPVEAASSMPTSTTVTAYPPRNGPSTRTRLCISRSAMPERSSMMPMKMNSGRATISSLATMP